VFLSRSDLEDRQELGDAGSISEKAVLGCTDDVSNMIIKSCVKAASQDLANDRQ
jgi:hypothetical protein